MRKVYLWFQGLKGTLFADFVLLMAVFLALLSFSDAFAAYRYVSFADQALNNVISSDRGVYFSDTSFIDPSDRLERNRIRMDLITSLEKDPAVRAVYAQADFEAFVTSGQVDSRLNLSVAVMTEGATKLMPSLSRGKWFERPVNDDGSINVVVVGTDMWDVPIGTIIDLSADERSYKAKVCGVMYSPALVPQFYSSGSEVSTQNFFSSTELLIVGDCEYTREILINSYSFTRSPKYFNFFVEFHDDASSEEINAVLSQLSAQGGYQELSDIRINSKNTLKIVFLKQMILPLFFVAISFVLFFSISILSVLKRIRSYSVYYLLGFSKKKIIMDISIHIMLILFLPTVLNVGYALLHRFMVMMRWIELPDINIPLHDGTSALITAMISFVMVAVTLIAVFAVLHRKSPADVWRRSKE